MDNGDGQHNCLKYQVGNSEKKYVCSLDDNTNCGGEKDIWCGDYSVFKNQIPDDTQRNFRTRNINIYNYCDRPIKIVSTIPQGVVGDG